MGSIYRYEEFDEVTYRFELVTDNDDADIVRWYFGFKPDADDSRDFGVGLCCKKGKGREALDLLREELGIASDEHRIESPGWKQIAIKSETLVGALFDHPADGGMATLKTQGKNGISGFLSIFSHRLYTSGLSYTSKPDHRKTKAG